MQHISELLEQVHHMALEIAGSTDTERVLRNTMQSFSRMGTLRKGWIAMEEGPDSFSIASYLNGVEKMDREFYAEMVRTVLRSGQPVLADDNGTPVENFSAPSNLLCLPLNYRSHVLGAVLLESEPSKYIFGKPELKVLSLLANHSAIALAHAKLFEAATLDGMTRLGIHRYFQIRLQQELSRALRHKLELSLLFLDVDHFKKFNDTYGHQTGDKVLIHVANILRTHTRGGDVCARYGGEEFAVLLPEARLQDALAVAERMRKKIESTPLTVNGKELSVTVSIGVSDVIQEKSMTPEILIERADQALYQAKGQGRNRVMPWQAQSKK